MGTPLTHIGNGLADPLQVTTGDALLIDAVEQALGHGVRVFATGHAVALDVLDQIVLPPGAEVQVDQAQMRALAALYLAADLEPAGVIPAVEALAGLVASGGLQMNLGPASAPLHQFWRDRNARLSSDERIAFFAQLFGVSSGPAMAAANRNRAFEDRMLDLCEALYKLDELGAHPAYGGIAQQARVRSAARALLYNLVEAGGGITAFLAEEVLKTLKDALEILKSPQLRGSFGARDVWSLIQSIGRLSNRRFDQPQLLVRRGRAGMTVLAWLAEVAPMLSQSHGDLVELQNPVVVAAVEWLETSLSLGETMVPPSPVETGSPWANIGV